MNIREAHDSYSVELESKNVSANKLKLTIAP